VQLRHATAVCSLAAAMCAAASVPASPEAVPAWRPVLTERTGRWEHEESRAAAGEQFGAEDNPTGNPIGGGPGYTDTLARGDFTVRAPGELRDALAKAQAGQIIFIPGDAEIDMSGQQRLSIPGGVTLASSRGWQGSSGALVYSDRPDTPGLLEAGGGYVRITGLRIRGPHQGRDQGPSAWGLGTNYFGTEIDNCEVSGFSFAGIAVRDGARRAHVHHCFIHHNQMSGLGYGVAVDDADALIEANQFDWCRHHIAGCNGRPGTGYEARYNICGANANSHLFDMHGEASGSGIAGDWLNIHHNTFLCTTQVSIGIRGDPSQGAAIHHNRFSSPDITNALFVLAHRYRSSAQQLALRWVAEALGKGNTHMYRNVFGEERRLVEGLAIDVSVLRATESSLRSLGRADLIDTIVTIRRREGSGAPATDQVQALGEVGDEGLVQIVMSWLEGVKGSEVQQTTLGASR